MPVKYRITLLLFLTLFIVAIASAQAPIQNGNSWIYPDANKNNVTAIAGQIGVINPTLNLTRWGNTDFLRIIPVGATVWTGISQVNGIITVSAQNVSVTMYEDKSLQGFEYCITYIVKPVSNVFQFGYTSAGLDFFYQPNLTQVYSVGQMYDKNHRIDSVTATTVMNGSTVLVSADPNYFGSYAVYLSNGLKGDYSAFGGFNYGNGKALQIMPPVATDAIGNKITGFLNITGSTLTVQIPQSWLNTATYPVVVDPNFGYQTVPTAALLVTFSANTYGFNASASPSQSGTLISMTAYCNASAAGKSLDVGLYADLTTHLPGARLASNTSSNILCPTGTVPAWTTVNVSASVTAGTQYWPAVGENSSSLYFMYDNAISGGKQQQASLFPDPFGVPSSNGASKIGLYGTYTTGGGTAPVASFTCAPTVGIVEYDSACQDTSSNTPTSWRWEMDNENGTQAQVFTIMDPVFNLSWAGNYTVNLSATNAFGTGFSNGTQLLAKNVQPLARYTQSDLNWTNNTGSLPFHDSSVLTNSTTPWWFWDIQNNNHGNNSYLQNPTFTFACNAADVYASNDYCLYSLNHQVNDSPGSIWNQSSQFWNNTWVQVYQNRSPWASFIGSPLTTSINGHIQFTATPAGSIKIDSYLWDFGNGTQSSLQNPLITPPVSGTFSITLNAYNWTLGNFTLTKVGYITVNPNPPVASFTYPASVGTVAWDLALTDTSTNSPTSWRWEIDNESQVGIKISTVKNPIFNMSFAGNYTVNMSAGNAGGQGFSNWTQVIAKNPTPLARYSQTTTNLTNQTKALTFTDTSVGTNVTGYLWDVENNNHQNMSTTQNPSYQFACNTGDYTAGDYCLYTLSHQVNDSGYFGTSTSPIWNVSSVWWNNTWVTVYGNSSPSFSFTANVNSGTRPLSVTLTPVTAGSIIIDSYNWTVEGWGNNVSNIASPTFIFGVAGTYGISLKATNFTLGQTLVDKPTYIVVSDPSVLSATASVSPLMGNTTTSFQYSGFNSTSTIIDIWNWTFSDSPTTFYYAQNIAHQFAAAGTYNGTLQVTNNTIGTFTTYAQTVTVYANGTPTISFTGAPLSGSAPLNVNFVATPGTDIVVDIWNWSFGDGHVSTVQNPSNIYINQGTYDVNLTAINRTLGVTALVKTTYITVTVSPPVASFTLNTSMGTQPLPVQFTDTSTGSPTSWTWVFGDGGTSNAQSPAYTYTVAGSYNVSLTATNAGGSSTAYFSLVIVKNPKPTASFTNADIVALSTPLSVTDTSTGTNITWWYYFFREITGGNSSGNQNPMYMFASTGWHEIDLIVNDSSPAIFNVSSNWANVTLAVYVKNNTPITSETCVPTSATVPPLQVICNDTTTGGPRVYINWTQGWGANISSQQNATFTYGATGTFTINHTVCNGESVRDSGNCSYSYPTIFIGSNTQGGYYLSANAPQPIDPVIPIVGVAALVIFSYRRRKT